MFGFLIRTITGLILVVTWAVAFILGAVFSTLARLIVPINKEE